METLGDKRNSGHRREKVKLSEYTTEFADDIDLDDLDTQSEPTFVAKLVECAIVRRDGRTLWHAAWEPLSFKQVFNKEAYDFRKDDYTHDNITAVTKDGRPMGGGTLFGKVRESFKDLGYPLTRNDSFRPVLEGKVFKVRRLREEWGEPDPITRRRRASFAIQPIEEIEGYSIPANREVRRIGFKDNIEQAQVSPDQIRKLKAALNGWKPEEFMDALMDSGDPAINCDPFVAEAAKGTLLTRLVEYGGSVRDGAVFFE